MIHHHVTDKRTYFGVTTYKTFTPGEIVVDLHGTDEGWITDGSGSVYSEEDILFMAKRCSKAMGYAADTVTVYPCYPSRVKENYPSLNIPMVHDGLTHQVNGYLSVVYYSQEEKDSKR